MTENQTLILEAQSFSGKENEQGIKREYNTLFCVLQNKYGHLVSNTLFCSNEVIKQFTGPGVYTTNFSIYIDRNGQTRTRLVELKKIKGVEF